MTTNAQLKLEKEGVIIKNVVALKATMSAILVRFANGDEQWIPRSQGDLDDGKGKFQKWNYDIGVPAKLYISKWFHEKIKKVEVRIEVEKMEEECVK